MRWRRSAGGLVGFDLADSAYFHRELPFDLSLVEKLQPRLQNARKLLKANKVRILDPPPTRSKCSWRVQALSIAYDSRPTMPNVPALGIPSTRTVAVRASTYWRPAWLWRKTRVSEQELTAIVEQGDSAGLHRVL